MSTWKLQFEIASIVLISANIILFYTCNRIETKLSLIFQHLMWIVLATSTFDIIAACVLNNPSKISIVLGYLFTILYNLGLILVIWLYVLYFIHLTMTDYKIQQYGLRRLCVPVIVEIILFCTTPLTHFIFYIDSEGVYHRGIGMGQWYFIGALYVLHVSFIALKKSKEMSKMQRTALGLWTVSIIACAFFQLVFPQYLLNSFGNAIGTILIYIALQGDFVDSDRMLGTYSNDALAKKISVSLSNNVKFQIVTVRLGGFEKINAVQGYEVADDVLRQIAEFLMKLIPRHQVFHLTGLYFACYLETGVEGAKEYVKKIEQRFETKFYSKMAKNAIDVPYGIALIGFPNQADSARKYSSLLNTVLTEPTLANNRKIIYLSEEDIDRYDRKIEVERAIERAVRNGTFKVYYQPIIDLETQKVHCAEALIRLQDEEYGYIYPDEFIPLAEENGEITQITNFVLNSVCRFYVDKKIEEKGVSFIEVNLSAVECVQQDTANRILSILNGYNIDNKNINLEITETAAVGRNAQVNLNIDSLTNAGVTLSLDDYGTGYSNMSQLLELPLEIAKVDKSMLWTAMKNDDAMCVLKKMTELLHSLGRKIVVEGVETREHVELLRKLGVQYAQGYCFSKPIPEEEFVEYLINVNEYGMSPYGDDL